MFDSNNVPVTKNYAGYDGGDSLANYCRYWLATYKTTPVLAAHKLNFTPFIVMPGIVCRHPGKGIDPGGKPYNNVPSFWSDSREVSRDNTRALHWLVALRFKLLDAGLSPQALLDLEDIYIQYTFVRKCRTAQNGDILLPLQFAAKGIALFLRDLELLFNLSVVCGLIPSFKHDAPFGLGKGKRIFFSWQDEDHVDGDVNMAADLIGCSLVKPTFLSKMATKIYKSIRGNKAISHYYREESGNNPEIGQALNLALE